MMNRGRDAGEFHLISMSNANKIQKFEGIHKQVYFLWQRLQEKLKDTWSGTILKSAIWRNLDRCNLYS